jgi:hypothetical protein
MEMRKRPRHQDQATGLRNHLKRGWIYVTIAWAIFALIVWYWRAAFPSRTAGWDEVNLFVTGFNLLVFFLGLPALLLLIGAARRAWRARASQTYALLLGIAAVLPVLFAAAAIPLAEQHIGEEQRAVDDQAYVSSVDRSGVVEIDHHGSAYRNTRDHCSDAPHGPPVACGPANQPACRGRSWLQAHRDWPLLTVGTYGQYVPGRAAFGPRGIILQRPVAIYDPPLMVIPRRSCYLEYDLVRRPPVS